MKNNQVLQEQEDLMHLVEELAAEVSNEDDSIKGKTIKLIQNCNDGRKLDLILYFVEKLLGVELA
ncbi:hypothetical protein ACJDU8_21615 [Clostridium sp. WILCCON 0269]|uniref:Uncharacterized protein n=1 Tax=Candidatus Clostridium eludens TaxID=3381663 RepID=A0ABW8SSM4_9CLOT